MVKRSRSTLLLIEQIIVIAIFAFCAAVCVNIIVSSYVMTTNAVQTRNALSVAESAAESFKAFEGNTDRIFNLLGEPNSGHATNDTLVVHFNENWQPSSPSDAFFVLNLTIQDDGGAVIFGEVVVTKIDGNDTLVELSVAVRRAFR
ncbi:MAG: hypothetical protein FWE44_06965 [Defluviitaleaceae bacterium]|nr:hypothetical protein [Defluviitaleaceae bacterium]